MLESSFHHVYTYFRYCQPKLCCSTVSNILWDFVIEGMINHYGWPSHCMFYTCWRRTNWQRNSHWVADEIKQVKERVHPYFFPSKTANLVHDSFCKVQLLYLSYNYPHDPHSFVYVSALLTGYKHNHVTIAR